MDQLPPELLDAIFVQLQKDRDTSALRSCSLVCKLWLACSRRHLFSRLVVPSWPQEHDVASLVHLLQSSHSIIHAVTHLVLAEQPFAEILQIEELLQTVGMLRRLRQLTISGRWIVGSGVLLESFARAAAALECLELNSLCEFGEVILWLIRLISCKKLRIGALTWPCGDTFLSEVVFASPAPSCIELQKVESHLQHFLYHLPSENLYENLRELRISFESFTELIVPISRLLGDSRCRLQFLTLDFANYYARGYATEAKFSPACIAEGVAQYLCPALQCLRSLQTFTLGVGAVSHQMAFNVKDRSEHFIPFWDVLAAIVRSLPSELEELHVVAHERFDMDPHAFRDALRRLGSLRRVVFRSWMDDAKKDEVLRAVPELSQYGTLQFLHEPFEGTLV